MNDQLRILLIGDAEEEYFILKNLMDRSSGGHINRTTTYHLDLVSTYEEANQAILECRYDLFLIDYQPRVDSGLNFLNESLVQECSSPMIVLTGQNLDAARDAIPSAEFGRLYLIERQYGRGKILAELTLSDPRIHRIDLPEDVQGPLKDMRDGYSLLIPDLPTVPALLPLMEKDQELQNILSVMIAPMILKYEVLGAVSLYALQASVFSETDLRLLTSFAATATAAIHNAMLCSDTQNLAASDPLTGQVNRRSFFELGQREIDRYQRFGRPFSWVMFDVDLFKQINDEHGHPIGD